MTTTANGTNLVFRFFLFSTCLVSHGLVKIRLNGKLVSMTSSTCRMIVKAMTSIECMLKKWKKTRPCNTYLFIIVIKRFPLLTEELADFACVTNP